MKRYLTKPSEVQAEQWFPGKVIEGVTVDGLNAGPLHPTKPQGTPLSRWIVLPDGEKIDIHPGDWIVQYPDGLGVVSDGFFQENYIPAVDHRAVLEASMRSTNAEPRPPVVTDDTMGCV